METSTGSSYDTSVESLVRQMFLACCTGPSPGGEGQYVDAAVEDYSLSPSTVVDAASRPELGRSRVRLNR